jgi:hypothetical protein
MRYMRILLLSVLVVLVIVLLIQTGRSVKDNPATQAFSALKTAKLELLEDTFRNVAAALDMYVTENNSYPASIGDLVPRYLTTGSETVDPWGVALRLRAIGESGYSLTSAGPDRAFGTGDDVERSFQ